MTLGSRVCYFFFFCFRRLVRMCLGNIFVLRREKANYANMSRFIGPRTQQQQRASRGTESHRLQVQKMNNKSVCRWLKSFLNYFRLRCTTRCRYFYNLWAWMEGIKNWNVLLNSTSQRQHKIDEEFFEVREWRNENIKVRVAAQGTTKTNGWEVGGESLALDIPGWAEVKKQQHSLIKPIIISSSETVFYPE